MGRPRRQEFQPKLAEFRREAGLTQEQVARELGISAEMVRRHERGAAMPILLYRKGYCDLFRASEEQLGFRNSAPRGEVGQGNPVMSSNVTVASTATGLQEFADETYLKAVRDHIKEIIALENRFGGDDLVRVSMRFFRKLHNQIGSGAFESRIERDLYSSAGELAEVIGWLAYDAEQHDLVRRMNQESLYFTRLAGDRTIELLTLQNASMHAAAIGRPLEALQIARSVLEGGDQLSARLRALFLTRKARALAQGGDESALHLFGEIRSLYLDGVADHDPPWAWWVDERELAWQEAMALRDLGSHGSALSQFERSVATLPSTEIRSHYLHRAFLLRAHVEVNSWAEVETTVERLRPLVEEVASARGAVILRGVIDTVRAHKRVPVAARDHIENLAHLLDNEAV